MLPYSIPHGVYCYITPPPLLLLPTSLMTLLCVCLQVPYSPVTLGPNDLHITQPFPCPYVSVIVIFLLTNDITLIFIPSTVTIKAQNNEMFKGFMVRGFVDGKPNGSFLNAPTGLTCDNIPNTAATHQDNALKNQVQLIWQGDANPVFRATIVKNRNSFFMI